VIYAYIGVKTHVYLRNSLDSIEVIKGFFVVFSDSGRNYGHRLLITVKLINLDIFQGKMLFLSMGKHTVFWWSASNQP
jgi:hypothetical protein